MTRTLYKTLTALLWLAPVAMGIRYAQVWNQLPLRMASHFDAAGRVNGWMPRDAVRYFDLGLLVFLAAVFTVVLLLVLTRYDLAKLSWALLIVLHAEIWALVNTLSSTLAYNLDGSAISIAPLLVVNVVGAIAITAFALGEKRGAALSTSDVLAEEVRGLVPSHQPRPQAPDPPDTRACGSSCLIAAVASMKSTA